MGETTKVPVQKSEKPNQPAALSSFGAIEDLRHEIDRLFDNVGRGMLGFPSARSLFRMMPDLVAPTVPAIDIVETDKEYRVTAEIPGLEPKDIEVKLTDGSLTVKGEKRSHKEETAGEYYLAERRYGAFERSFPLPQGVDRDRIEARVDKGVLTLTLPKTPDAQKQARTIEVKAA